MACAGPGIQAGWEMSIWRHMGWAGKAGVAAGLLLGLASCAGTRPEGAADPGARFGPGYPPGSLAWSAGEREAYRVSFAAGMRDQREGYRFDDDRGALALELKERGFYRQGYRRGYYRDEAVRRQARRAAGAGAEAEAGAGAGANGFESILGESAAGRPAAPMGPSAPGSAENQH